MKLCKVAQLPSGSKYKNIFLHMFLVAINIASYVIFIKALYACSYIRIYIYIYIYIYMMKYPDSSCLLCISITVAMECVKV